MPAQAKFIKVHHDFMGHTPSAMNFMLGKALIIAEKTGIDNEFYAAIFKYLQTDRATITNEKDIRHVFVLSGGDVDKFDQDMKCFSVIAQAKEEKKIPDELSQKTTYQHANYMVVNGKHLIDSKSLDRNNFLHSIRNWSLIYPLSLFHSSLFQIHVIVTYRSS
ncbi:hypothetical protein [Cognaticolwellia beringensis]|uniref:Uncharacterized protein n=1 Tax=Cognaticolwellia beringensis TaxID=1967665 RepID=A0A222G7C5_9GAMM|nr:hypothetical protein [Cognaticolwellia beringensis]ASP47690.1 hypothetical protein B5D82_07930 [Cognaticolwellia beringensis]